jgi:formylglycine-generating enzyme required for sulfatase activity
VKNAEDRAWPVGRLRPNEQGLFDALGNALEWTETPPLSYATNQPEDMENAKYLAVDDRISRILRGGSFARLPANLRCASRLGNRPGNRLSTNGFRHARTLP